MATPQENSGSQFQTINKLWEFPIFSQAWTQSTGLYNRVKEANPVITNALNVAECSVQFAAQTSAPAVQRFQSQLNYVDQTVANGLTTLEQRAPIVKADPTVLFEGAKSFLTSRVTDVRQNMNVRSLKDLAKEKANEVLNSHYGNIAFQGFTNSSFFAEQFIDHYLPLQTDDQNSTNQREVAASLVTDQDKILFTIQTIGRIAGKLKRGVTTGIYELNARTLRYLNQSPLMINLAGYLNLVNEHLSRQQQQQHQHQSSNNQRSCS